MVSEMTPRTTRQRALRPSHSPSRPRTKPPPSPKPPRKLDRLRTAWLNPPEWTRRDVFEFPGGIDGPWSAFVHDPDLHGIGMVHYPRLVPRDPDCAELLVKRTLTNLYNERPTWLDLAHQTLDAAVFAAYDWDPAMSDEEILEKLLALNLERAGNG